MNFTSRKIARDQTPFLKERSHNQSINPRVFFGPPVLAESKGRFIFSKNLFLWILIFLLILSYIILGFKNFFAPPEVVIYSPENNFVTSEKVIKIKGQIKGEAMVAINDQAVTLNQNSFEENITLSSGVNLIKISVRKKFGPEKVIFRRIIVE